MIDKIKPLYVSPSTVRVIESTFNEIEKNFPGLVPKFNPKEFLALYKGQYNYISISSFIGTAISKLRVEIEDIEITPVTEKRNFPFISDNELRKILERDWANNRPLYKPFWDVQSANEVL